MDGHIQRIAGTSVPMLRVADSAAIARHAAGLGLLDAASIAAIDAEVARDHGRPGLGEAALAEAVTPAEPSQPA